MKFKNKLKEIMSNLITILFILVLLNMAVTSITYRFIHPEKTEVQAFLKIPQTFLWNFEK